MARQFFSRRKALELFTKIVLKSRGQQAPPSLDPAYCESLLYDVKTAETYEIVNQIRDYRRAKLSKQTGAKISPTDTQVAPKVLYYFQQKIIEGEKIYTTKKTFQQFKDYIEEPSFNPIDDSKNCDRGNDAIHNNLCSELSNLFKQGYRGIQTTVYFSCIPPKFFSKRDEHLAVFDIPSVGSMTFYSDDTCYLEICFMPDTTRVGYLKDRFRGKYKFVGSRKQYLVLNTNARDYKKSFGLDFVFFEREFVFNLEDKISGLTKGYVQGEDGFKMFAYSSFLTPDTAELIPKNPKPEKFQGYTLTKIV